MTHEAMQVQNAYTMSPVFFTILPTADGVRCLSLCLERSWLSNSNIHVACISPIVLSD